MIAGMSKRAFEAAMKYFGCQVYLRKYTRAESTNGGDIVETLSSESTISAIFDMDNDSSSKRDTGRHTESTNLIFVRGSETVSKGDKIYNPETLKSYLIEDIRAGYPEATPVYLGLIVAEVA